MHDPNQPAPWTGAGQEACSEFREAVAALIEGEADPLACLANVSSAIFYGVPRLNWAGFYLLRGGELVLGPFQGRPACTRIKVGHGVCGTAASRGVSIRVPDVSAFPGHIACDTASRSELVVPLIWRGALAGVLDLDSPDLDRFSAADQDAFERLAELAAPHASALASRR